MRLPVINFFPATKRKEKLERSSGRRKALEGGSLRLWIPFGCYLSTTTKRKRTQVVDEEPKARD